jgi:hypothetical protein
MSAMIRAQFLLCDRDAAARSFHISLVLFMLCNVNASRASFTML